jgi:hypothetical protein
MFIIACLKTATYTVKYRRKKDIAVDVLFFIQTGQFPKGSCYNDIPSFQADDFQVNPKFELAV